MVNYFMEKFNLLLTHTKKWITTLVLLGTFAGVAAKEADDVTQLNRFKVLHSAHTTSLLLVARPIDSSKDRCTHT